MRTLPTAQGVRLLLKGAPQVVLRPQGTSMVPTIVPGEEVVVAPTRRLRPGDIVLVDGPRLHRVLAIDEARSTIVTKGDAMNAPDPPVPLSAVAAVVVCVRRSLRLRARFLLARRFRLLARALLARATRGLRFAR